MTAETSRDPVMSEWAGLENFGCPFCSFSSVDRVNFDTHMEFSHPDEERSPLLVERRERERETREARAADKAKADEKPVDPKSAAPKAGKDGA